ncbi:unnamed protein product [Choristocarpus tenellus]
MAFVAPLYVSSEDVTWLSELPYTLSFPSLGFLVVHAGLVPGVPLEEQRPWDMVTMRNVLEQEVEGGRSYQTLETSTEGVAWAKAWRGPQHVYFGHDAKRGFQQEAFATGLDTGCLYGKSLSAVIVPGGRVVAVQAKDEYVVAGGSRGGEKQGGASGAASSGQ